jgi:hypothetical protein
MQQTTYIQFSSGFHGSGIRTVVGFGETETSDDFTGGEFGDELVLDSLRTEGVDRVHNQGRLDRHGRSVSTINSFNFSGDQT